MHATVTQLDRMLYEWLAETDDRRFDLAFKRYYAEASSHVVRYLSRRSSLADLDCEQIAVDALLRFFGRVGRDRRLAAQSVSAALPRIEPLNLGPFHVRQVGRWTTEVGTFRHASMSFTAHQDAAESWKAQIQTLTDGITPLQRQGCHLLESARTACHAIAPPEVPAGAGDDATAADGPISTQFAVIREFALALRNAAQSAAGPGDPELRHPGLLGFVDGCWTVVEALPLLRVPTNGYLFDIAQSLYLDECKARGRRKRGGSGFSANGADQGLEAGTMPPSPLDDAGWPEEEDDGSRSGAFAASFQHGDFCLDPVLEQIDDDFCEQFYRHLRKPLEVAEEAYHQAAARGRGEAERKRLESVAKKNERLMTVLAMRIEGRTQEEIAENLSISRNQVKYIVELVQSAYEQFCKAAARSRAP